MPQQRRSTLDRLSPTGPLQEPIQPPRQSTLDRLLPEGGSPILPPRNPSLLSLVPALTPKPIKTVVSTLMDLFTRVPAATMGVLNESVKAEQAGAPNYPWGKMWEAAKGGLKGEHKTAFADVLGSAGMKEGGLRSTLGLAGDVVLDPQNLAPVTKIPQAIKGLGQLGLKGMQAKTPMLVEAFRLYGNAPEAVRNILRLNRSTEFAEQTKAGEKAIQTFRGVPEQATRERLAFAIDRPEKFPLTTAAEKTAVAGHTAGMSTLADDLIAGGLMRPEQKLEDYISYVIREPKVPTLLGGKKVSVSAAPADPFLRTRHLKSLEQAQHAAEAKGQTLITDAANIFATREFAGRRALVRANMLRDMVANPELSQYVIKAEKGVEVPKGWKGVNWIDAHLEKKTPFGEEMSQYRFAPEVANALNSYMEVRDPGRVVQFMNSFHGLWKPMATIIRPAFHMRNALSNAYYLVMAGVNDPRRPLESAYLMLSRNPKIAEVFGKSGVDRIMKAVGKTQKFGKYTREEALDYMERYGVMGTEFGVVGDIGETGKLISSPPTKLSKFNPWQQGSYPRQMGQTIEDHARSTLFLDRLTKGDTAEQAAITVKKWLFDYTELTDFEKTYLRTGYPFYKWLRSNIPLQIETMLTEPGRYSAPFKWMQSMEREVPADIKVPREERADYIQRQEAVQKPFLSDTGEKEFASYGLPFMDLNKFPMPQNLPSLAQLKGQGPEDESWSLVPDYQELSRSVREFASGGTPLAKAPLEYGFNRNLLTGADLTNKDLGLQKAPQLISGMAEQFPAVGLLLSKLGMVSQEHPAGGAEWYGRPEIIGLLNQFPIMSSVGKAVTTGVGERGGKVPVGPGSLPVGVWNFLMAPTLIPQTEEQRTRSMGFEQQRQGDQAKAELMKKLLKEAQEERLQGKRRK